MTASLGFTTTPWILTGQWDPGNMDEQNWKAQMDAVPPAATQGTAGPGFF